jgi:hypothetical protein
MSVHRHKRSHVYTFISAHTDANTHITHAWFNRRRYACEPTRHSSSPARPPDRPPPACPPHPATPHNVTCLPKLHPPSPLGIDGMLMSQYRHLCLLTQSIKRYMFIIWVLVTYCIHFFMNRDMDEACVLRTST